jgi:protocatechuate 3,4-dioxygenase alpha subunit
MTDLTPSQTIGPFLHIGLPWTDGPLAAAADAPGAITITGRVTDGAGEPLPDGLVETWQSGGEGRSGFGRCPTDKDGGYRIVTVRPVAQPDRDGRTEAPHIDVSLFSRGLLDRLVTRIYFPDAEENAADPVLESIDTDRRDTLIATATGDGYRFDIRLQGDRETVFFDV